MWSHVKTILHGRIPQGLYFRQLFFQLYINDLPALDNSTPRLFADDTNLTVSGVSINEIETAMNLDLMCVKEWFHSFKQIH